MIPPDQKIKVCLVGAGVWGRQHARVFSQRPDVQLCAVAGRTLAKTQARAAEFGLRPYTNVQEMLATEKPDLVSLSLPNLEHFEATMQVIETGYSLLVEKPLTFDLSEADQLLAQAEKRGLFFAINFNHRYAKPLRLAREAIKAGRLGDITHATWRLRRRSQCELPPSCQSHRNSVSRLRSVRGFMRSDYVGHGRDDRPDRRRLSHDSYGSTIRERSSREHDGHL